MKPLIISGILAIAVGIIAVAYFIFPAIKTDKTSTFPSPSESKGVVFSALITPIHTNVFAQAPSETSQNEIKIPSRVNAGTRVKTSETGRAIIEGTQTSFLDFNAEVVIAPLDSDKKSRVYLESGKTWSRVQKIFDKGEFYQLETKNAVAVVHGTSFGLYFEFGDTTTLLVTEGEVRFFAKDIQTGVIMNATETIVTSGQKAVRKGSESIAVSIITAHDKGDWFIFNNPPSSPTNSPRPSLSPTRSPSSTPIKSAAPIFTYIPTPTPALTPTPQAVMQFYMAMTKPREVEIKQVATQEFQIDGAGLDQLVSLQLGEVKITDYKIIDSEMIKFYTHARLEPGYYSLFAKNKTGRLISLESAIHVYDATPPPASTPMPTPTPAKTQTSAPTQTPPPDQYQ